MSSNSILVQGLCKSFGDFILDNVSFSVPKGELLDLLEKTVLEKVPLSI